MAIMLTEIYDALRSFGVAEDKAAEAMTLESHFAMRQYRADFASMLMIAALFTLGLAANWLVFRIAYETGAIG